MNQIGNPLISFVIYLSREASLLSLQSFLNKLKSFNKDNAVQLIFINAANDPLVLEEIKKHLNQFHILYFKVSSDLGESYAYNLVLPHIKGEYCHFISPVYTLNDNYFDVLETTIKKTESLPDFIVTYNPCAINYDHFQENVYQGLSIDLILSLNTSLRYYIINSKFLLASKVRFHDFTFYPFSFIICLLLQSHLITFVNAQLITCSFPPLNNFNVYDILYQAYEILSFLNLKGVYERYFHEWDYLLIIIVYHVFLKVLTRAYNIDINNKKSMKKNHQLLNFALISVKKITTKLRIKIPENKYLQADYNAIFEIYNKISKAIK